MIPARELLGKRETVFTYHEDGVTRCWAVQRALADIESGALSGRLIPALLVASTARTLMNKSGLGHQRLFEIMGNPARLHQPGVLMYPDTMNDRNPLIVDGRHRYVALCVLGHDRSVNPFMSFYTFTESELAPYEVEMDASFTDQQAEIWSSHVSQHRV